MAADDVADETSSTTVDAGAMSDGSALLPPSVETAPAANPWTPSALRQPLSKLQAIVGVTAGVISVFSVVAPIAGSVKIPVSGEFVGVVEEARTRRPLTRAAVEIVGRTGNAVVATVVSNEDGRVHVALKEGQYRVRVSHRDFAPEVRHVLVIGGRTSEVHLVLSPRLTAPPPAAAVVDAKPIVGTPRGVRGRLTAPEPPPVSREPFLRPQTP